MIDKKEILEMRKVVDRLKNACWYEWDEVFARKFGPGVWYLTYGCHYESVRSKFFAMYDLPKALRAFLREKRGVDFISLTYVNTDAEEYPLLSYDAPDYYDEDHPSDRVSVNFAKQVLRAQAQYWIEHPREIEPGEDAVLVNVYLPGRHLYLCPEDWIRDTQLPDIEEDFRTTVVLIPDEAWDQYPHMAEFELMLTAWGMEVHKQSQYPDCEVRATFSPSGDCQIVN